MSDAPAAFFPVFLRLSGRRVLLVGAGPVGASKLQGLLDAGALVTVVAPEIVADIEQAAANHASSAAPAVTLKKRPFDVSDLDGVWYVVAAATPAVNRAVAQAAEARQLFVNAVDDPPNATAYLGGVLRRGGVTVAISTDGHAPALAGLLREGLDALLPHELNEWLDEARAVRKKWLADGVPMEERRPLLLKALNEIYARRATAKKPESEAETKTETEVHA
jgi:uroporphyrin-III C-methyltransferase/precorrin-2 dehydrogenase/sirohydrochlorin ferrochelatase